MVFLKDGEPYISVSVHCSDACITVARFCCQVHQALPFGGVASVHGWDRVGSLLKYLGMKLLQLPLGRYVDDFWSGDRAECAKVAMDCFARMVRALLGETAVAVEKLEVGPSLVILGAECTVTSRGLTCIPDHKKRKKWESRISEALNSSKMTSGEASKLSGALQWATQHQFKKLGRAMIRPIYK